MKNYGDLVTTQYGGELAGGSLDRESEIVRTMARLQQEYNDRRREKTERILACWAAYLGTPNATRWQRASAMRTENGDIGVDWRHKISRAKAYEVVENIVPYLVGATFPNDDWFDMIPQTPINDPEYLLFVKIMKTYMNVKLTECKFRDHWETFIRQMVITGTSIISLPWRVESRPTKQNVKVKVYGANGNTTATVEKTFYNAPEVTVEDIMDFWLDPDGTDPNTSNLIRRLVLTRGQVIRLAEEGCYDIREVDIWKLKPLKRGKSDDREMIDDFLGINRNFNVADQIEIFEFWGDVSLKKEELRNVVVTWCGDHLLRVENNPYWHGKPFIVGTYTQMIGTPYGFGALEPVLGDLHEIDIISNIRLDGEEVSLMPTWLITNDGTVDPNEIVVEPGRVIPVADVNSVRPLQADMRFVSVSINEEQLREATIDRRTATGAFVGTGEGRSGERVTAAEVQAAREAGGNRLSGVYAHIESTALLPCLQLVYEYARQFVVKDEMIPVPGKSADEVLYVMVGIDQLQQEFNLRPKGATHIADKEYELRAMTDWVGLMGSNPEMAKNINWLEVTKELTRRFIPFQPDRFIAEQQPAADPNAADPLAQVANQAQAIGGTEMQQAVQGQIAADGGMNMMQPQLSAAPPSPVNPQAY